MEDKTVNLTDDEQELIESIKRDSDKFRGLMFAGMVSIITGLAFCLGYLFMEISESYILIGVFFLTIGMITIRDGMRSRRLYNLLSKLLPSNQMKV